MVSRCHGERPHNLKKKKLEKPILNKIIEKIKKAIVEGLYPSTVQTKRSALSCESRE